MALDDLLHPYLPRYMEAPHWLKASAGRAYSMLSPRLRLGGAYDRFQDEIAATTSAQAVQALAAQKLDATLSWALASVPAYEGFRGLAEGRRDPRDVLAELPVTDKLDIKRHPERYLSN